ncbi:hypothetical protein ABZP36_021165 [Zizania latifolia]
MAHADDGTNNQIRTTNSRPGAHELLLPVNVDGSAVRRRRATAGSVARRDRRPATAHKGSRQLKTLRSLSRLRRGLAVGGGYDDDWGDKARVCLRRRRVCGCLGSRVSALALRVVNTIKY